MTEQNDEEREEDEESANTSRTPEEAQKEAEWQFEALKRRMTHTS